MRADPHRPDDKTQQLKAEHIKKRELGDVAFIMQSVEGRRFIYRLLEQSYIFRTTMQGNSWSFFYEGMRNLGLLVYQDIMEVCPDRYIEMCKEAKKIKQEDNNYGRK